MNALTEQQKEKALKRFVYCQEYYKSIKKHTKMNVFKVQINILIKLNQTQKSSKNLKTKKNNIIKELERKSMQSYAKRNEL